MTRLLRSSILPTVAALALLTLALLLPGGATTTPMREVSATPTVSPSPTSGCYGCVDLNDAICWEGPAGCGVVVLRSRPASTVVTIHYRTVPGTARPQVDYVDVRSATLVMQPGQTSAVIPLQLIPDPALTQDRTFGVELTGVSGAGVLRSTATVTIRPRP